MTGRHQGILSWLKNKMVDLNSCASNSMIALLRFSPFLDFNLHSIRILLFYLCAQWLLCFKHILYSLLYLLC
ncbi:unnamed protein product [Ilex paraguariensis]|uniref:Uncharacterized protein n=1 Tax=Ilex paraguariensis TaxID=185542 RepID=A0ABC8V517_9AQUA